MRSWGCLKRGRKEEVATGVDLEGVGVGAQCAVAESVPEFAGDVLSNRAGVLLGFVADEDAVLAKVIGAERGQEKDRQEDESRLPGEGPLNFPVPLHAHVCSKESTPRAVELSRKCKVLILHRQRRGRRNAENTEDRVNAVIST